MKRIFSAIDLPLLLIVLAISAVGLFTVYSATIGNPQRLEAQLINFGVALLLMWFVAIVPPKNWAQSAIFFYLIGIILLLAVFFAGVTVNGAKRWLSLGFTRIQPSEMLKIVTPMTLAWFFHQFQTHRDWRHFVVAFVILAIPFFLIAKQPDLGTALLVGACGFFVIFLAGLPWKVIFTALILGGVCTPFLWNLLHGYQKKRILTLLDPMSDPLGAGYHIIQSTIAIGSGGAFGKGFLRGTQTHLEFIPEKHTDFIFAVFSEEWGFAGNMILLSLYFLLIARGLYIAFCANQVFSRLLAGAISLGFFSYAFINMGMVSGILPVVGVPLPFMSYGGTALLTLFGSVGLLMSIHAQTRHSKKHFL